MKPLIKKYGFGKPVVAIVGSVHGDEPVGARIVKELAKIKLIKGSLITIIGNPEALAKKKRFIDTDLNRSFSKNAKKSKEQKIAFEILKALKNVDFVLDIHSTTTNTSHTIIAPRLTKNIEKIISSIKPQHVVVISRTMADNSLIGNVSAGISLEYGKHHAESTYNDSYKDVLYFLSSCGLIEQSKNKKIINNTTKYFKIFSEQEKPSNFKMNSIKNLQLIRRGTILGHASGKAVKAKEDFFPFLFGPKSYPTIMGFKAKRVK